MKKFFFPVLCCAGMAAFFFSCKHQPLDDGLTTGNGTTGGTGGSGGSSGGTTVTCSPDTAYFQQQVLPIFISNCTLSGCHDAASHQDGVILTNYASIVTTGDVRPGLPSNSKIYKVLNETDPNKVMPRPPRNPLSQAQKDIIAKWIAQGARNNSCTASACDSVNVMFGSTIRGIINNKCAGCHSGTPPQGGINFSAYSGVKAKVDDGRLWGAINHLSGYSPMPKGGTKLSDCEIKQFQKWIAAGAPNN